MRFGSLAVRMCYTAGVAAALTLGVSQAVAAPAEAAATSSCVWGGPTSLAPCRCPDGSSGWCGSYGQCNCPY
jgi:hypothetical protein